MVSLPIYDCWGLTSNTKTLRCDGVQKESSILVAYECSRKSWYFLFSIQLRFLDLVVCSYLKTLSWFPTICLLFVFSSNLVYSSRRSICISTCFQLWFTFDFFFLASFNTFRKSSYLLIFSEDTPQYSYMWWSKPVPSRSPTFLYNTYSLSLSYHVTLHNPATLHIIRYSSITNSSVKIFMYRCWMYDSYINNTMVLSLRDFSRW